MQGVRTAAAGTTAAAAAAATAGSSAFRRALPWLIGALVLAFIYFGLMRSRPTPPTVETAPVAALPSAQGNASTAGLRETVYFEVGQVALAPDAQNTIVTFAERIKQQGIKVNVTGYTDPTGDPAKNAELAKERAKAVRGALLAAGVAETSINVQPPESITGTGSEMEARRVEIAQTQ
jgi:outer membrane protein OmpA-like peptidoglycan-associated protein